MFEIRVDKNNQLIEVCLSGMMTVGEVADYINELKRQFVAHGLRRYAMVIDVSRCPIQDQSMVQAMGRHMADMPKAYALAVVTGSSLARMQVKRLFTQSYARIVSSVAEGRSWVLLGIEPSSWDKRSASNQPGARSV